MLKRISIFAGVIALLFAGSLFLGHSIFSSAAAPGPSGLSSTVRDMPDFRLIDQDGHALARPDLDNSVWIADFIYLQCTSSCGVLSGKIADLQARLNNPSVRFVSFSLSRDDGQGALKQYERDYRRADATRWRLLAADDTELPRLLVRLNLADSEDQARKGWTAINPHFFLIDRNGRIVGTYDGTDDRQTDQLVADASALLANESRTRS